MRIKYDQERLLSWEFEAIRDTAYARTEVKVKLNFNETGKISRVPTEHVFFMINYAKNEILAAGGDPKSEWRIFNWDWINFQ